MSFYGERVSRAQVPQGEFIERVRQEPAGSAYDAGIASGQLIDCGQLSPDGQNATRQLIGRRDTVETISSVPSEQGLIRVDLSPAELQEHLTFRTTITDEVISLIGIGKDKPRMAVVGPEQQMREIFPELEIAA